MKRLFISQPMNGRTDEDIKDERDRLARKVSKAIGENVEIIDSLFKNKFLNPKKNSDLQCLGQSLEQMANADIAYFAKGWRNARGCRIEHECALAYGIQVKYE